MRPSWAHKNIEEWGNIFEQNDYFNIRDFVVFHELKISRPLRLKVKIQLIVY